MTVPRRAFAALALTATLALATSAAGSAVPRTSTSGVSANCPHTFSLLMFDRAARTVYQGTGTPPRGSYRSLWHLARCQRPPSSEPQALKAWGRYLDAWHLRRHPPEPQGYGYVPGVPYSFASCVAWRESGDGTGGPDIYGILPMNGYYSGMSIAAQKALFSAMYARDGIEPWSPYDGCT